MMRRLIIYLFVGTLSLAACGTLTSSQQTTDQPEIPPTETAQTEVALPVATASPSPEVIEPTPISPLPAPTVSEATAVSPVATPVPSQSEQTGHGSDELTGQAQGAVIIYQVSGGFAGIDEQWAIYPDGRVTHSDGREWHVTPAQVEQLVADIKALGFFELNDSYMPLNACCDRFTYAFTVYSGDHAKTVTTIDAAPNAPAGLLSVQEKLSNFLASLG